MFRFNITLSEEDYLQFSKYHYFNSTNGQKSFLAYRALAPMLSIMFVLVFLMAGADPLLIGIEAVVLGIFSVIFLRNSRKTVIRYIHKSVERAKKDGVLPYTPESVLTFDEEFVHEISPKSEQKMEYQLLQKIAVDEGAVYIYINAMQAYILPASCFVDEGEKETFLKFVRGKVSPSSN